MKTYRCPFCSAQTFSFQDVELPAAQEGGGGAVVAIKVECTACHWVGDIEQLRGHH
jgi:hypothetical protein